MVRATQPILTVKILRKKLLKLRQGNLEVFEGFCVFKTRKLSWPELTHQLSKLLHKETVLGCENRCADVICTALGRIKRTTFRVSIVSSKVCNDGALWDQVTLRRFEHRDESSVDIFVPLSLVPQVHMAILKVNLFGCKSEESLLDERSQRMTI